MAPPRTPLQISTCCDTMRRDFLYQPGLCLTQPQAERLWGLAPPVCERALFELVQEGFLVATIDGCFRRPDYATFCGQPRS
jgi:hypothetical protein